MEVTRRLTTKKYSRVSDLFKCSHEEEKGKKFEPPENDLDAEQPDKKKIQQKVVLDAIEDVPALLQHSQHNDPSLCKLTICIFEFST